MKNLLTKILFTSLLLSTTILPALSLKDLGTKAILVLDAFNNLVAFQIMAKTVMSVKEESALGVADAKLHGDRVLVLASGDKDKFTDLVEAVARLSFLLFPRRYGFLAEFL